MIIPELWRLYPCVSLREDNFLLVPCTVFLTSTMATRGLRWLNPQLWGLNSHAGTGSITCAGPEASTCLWYLFYILTSCLCYHSALLLFVVQEMDEEWGRCSVNWELWEGWFGGSSVHVCVCESVWEGYCSYPRLFLLKAPLVKTELRMPVHPLKLFSPIALHKQAGNFCAMKTPSPELWPCVDVAIWL